ncbi:MAG: hypothetical protein J5760_07050 [Clostridia bacterium]|nr:hypothetical protein [Clostridia bacterium]
MSVLDEVRAAEEKAAQAKEQARAESAEAIRGAEKAARAEAARIILDAQKKAEEIAKESKAAYENAEKQFETELKNEKDRLTVIATSNRKEAADFAVSLL